MKIQRARLMHPSGKPQILAPIFPNAGVEAWYRSTLDQYITAMYHDAQRVVMPTALDTPALIVSDALPKATAAGVLFRTRAGKMLLCHRTDDEGWAFPGGGVEARETAESAARREVAEELNYTYTGPLTFEGVQRWRDVKFATFIADVEEVFNPLLDPREHDAYTWVPLSTALSMALHPGVREFLERGLNLAADAASTTNLQRALERWGQQWIKRFDLMSQRISKDFAAKNQNATEAAMRSQFARAGFTVKFKPTRKSIEAYRAVAAEQVGLIRSIAQKFHTDIQSQVWESVKRGGDMRQLSQKLEHTYGVTRRRVSLIARDQNNKAKAVIEAVRHQELGIKQAIWMHSHAGKEPRPPHVRANNKLYDITKGIWDSDEQAWVLPGQLINCRCTMRPFIPGFETTAYPEWEML